MGWGCGGVLFTLGVGWGVGGCDAGGGPGRECCLRSSSRQGRRQVPWRGAGRQGHGSGLTGWHSGHCTLTSTYPSPVRVAAGLCGVTRARPLRPGCNWSLLGLILNFCTSPTPPTPPHRTPPTPPPRTPPTHLGPFVAAGLYGVVLRARALWLIGVCGDELPPDVSLLCLEPPPSLQHAPLPLQHAPPLPLRRVHASWLACRCLLLRAAATGSSQPAWGELLAESPRLSPQLPATVGSSASWWGQGGAGWTSWWAPGPGQGRGGGQGRVEQLLGVGQGRAGCVFVMGGSAAPAASPAAAHGTPATPLSTGVV